MVERIRRHVTAFRVVFATLLVGSLVVGMADAAPTRLDGGADRCPLTGQEAARSAPPPRPASSSRFLGRRGWLGDRLGGGRGFAIVPGFQTVDESDVESSSLVLKPSPDQVLNGASRP